VTASGMKVEFQHGSSPIEFCMQKTISAVR
jgi:hypothetical protein